MQSRNEIPFVCPSCESTVDLAKNKMICQGCEERYSVEGEVPVFIRSIDEHYFEFLNELQSEVSQGKADELYESESIAFERVLSLLDGSGTVLDLAAGFGGLSRLLRNQGWSPVATDVNVQRARTVSERGIPTTVSLVDSLPFPSESFDAVCNTVSLQHFNQPTETVEEISRVLKPGGTFVIVFLNIVNAYWRLKFLFGDWEAITRGQQAYRYLHSTMTRSQFIDLAQEYGLVLTEDASYTPLPDILSGIGGRSAVSLPLPSLTSVYLVMKFKYCGDNNGERLR